MQSIFQSQILFALCFQCNYLFFNVLRFTLNRVQHFCPKLPTLIRISSAIADILSQHHYPRPAAILENESVLTEKKEADLAVGFFGLEIVFEPSRPRTQISRPTE